MEQGRRPDLVGGGLVRSLGGWSAVKALRRLGLKEPSDDRILGSGDFVARMIEKAENTRMRLTPRDTKNKIQEVIATTCKDEGISVKELKAGGRRRPVAIARRPMARTLIDYGVTLAEAARQLGVSTAAISLTLSRKN